MSELLKTIEMTVMGTTVEDLNYLAKTSNLSIGEVVDRLTARVASKDLDIVHQLVSEDVVILMAHLSMQDQIKLLYEVIKEFLSVFPDEAMEMIIADAKAERAKAQDKVSAMTQEEKDEMKRQFDEAIGRGWVKRGSEDGA